MSFLAPFFLLGALGIALPVAFHLIRRATKDQTPFGSLMFLRPEPPRLTRRNRLEHLLLLALRCLALALLALGFARPFLRRATAAEEAGVPGRRRVVLLDVSASMRRQGFWAEARRLAGAAAREAGPADQLEFLAFDRRTRPLLSFAEWGAAPVADRAALLESRLGALAPGWAGTSLGTALVAAAEALAEADPAKPSPAKREVLLISDLQEGGRLDGLQAYEWPKGVALSVSPVRGRGRSNAGLQLAAAPESGDATPAAVRVRVSNAADSAKEQFQVAWRRADGALVAGSAVPVYVPPGQSRVVTLPRPTNAPAPDRIVLSGDDDDFDNTLYTTVPEPTHASVLYLGEDAAGDPRQPLFFLDRALAQTGRLTLDITARTSSQSATPAEVGTAGLVVISDSPTEASLREVRAGLLAGKTVLFSPKSAGSAGALASLLGGSPATLEEAAGGEYALLGDVDFRHPLFAPFANPRYSDFTKIRFWKHRRLNLSGIPAARIAARFDQGDPAVVDIPVGAGRLVVLLSGWHPGDSQLALSSKFVPLLYSLLAWAGVGAPPPVQYGVGDVVPLPGLTTGGLTVRPPEGEPLALAAGATNFDQTATPGIYTVGPPSGPALRRFAVNLDPAESKTSPLAVEDLERFGAPAKPLEAAAPGPAATAAVAPARTEAESRQKLWRWLLAATLAALVVESALAGRMARQGLQSTEAAA